MSEIELLGYPKLSKNEEEKLKLLLNDCFIIEWNSKLKDKTISLKKDYQIKLPDAIIAATAIIYSIPLITADKGFKPIKNLDLVVLDLF
ncbi:MAG: PIN domain-containing protein [Bacteroidia bacterium]|nr:PIN domain-containing protein [Bacteroidia bacterium]